MVPALNDQMASAKSNLFEEPSNLSSIENKDYLAEHGYRGEIMVPQCMYIYMEI